MMQKVINIWAAADNDEHAWKMVAYVRHLPKLTPDEKHQVLEKAGEPMDHGADPQSHNQMR